MMNRILMGALAALVSTLPLQVMGGEGKEERIAHAQSAAPDFISEDATVIIEGTVVREGSNGWTCMPDTMPGDNAPMCNDSEWMEMLGAVGNKEDYTPDAIGISYMLKGDRGAGVSNSDPYADHPNAEDYVELGPHLMIIAPRELLKSFPSDPAQGGPWVMWGDTPYAHLMVPVGD